MDGWILPRFPAGFRDGHAWTPGGQVPFWVPPGVTQDILRALASSPPSLSPCHQLPAHDIVTSLSSLIPVNWHITHTTTRTLTPPKIHACMSVSARPLTPSFPFLTHTLTCPFHSSLRDPAHEH